MHTYVYTDVALIIRTTITTSIFIVERTDGGSVTRLADRLVLPTNFSVSKRPVLTNAQKREKLDHSTLPMELKYRVQICQRGVARRYSVHPRPAQ